MRKDPVHRVFDREKFFQGGREILDAVATFWDGLESDRVNKVYS